MVDLARELAQRLGVQPRLVTFTSAGQVVEALKADQVDIAFVAQALRRHGIESAAVAPAEHQSANLAALVDAGIRSFKIEGRYKDLAYVKNITAHYRKLFDELLEQRPELARTSSGKTTFSFTHDPDQNFKREFTDYFMQGRKENIGAFDTPKNPGRHLDYVTKVGSDFIELTVSEPGTVLHNGDGLCYYDLQKELVGLAHQPRRAGRPHGRGPVARLSQGPHRRPQRPAPRRLGRAGSLTRRRLRAPVARQAGGAARGSTAHDRSSWRWTDTTSRSKI